MNVLWIEDFGGGLQAGRNVLNQMFGGLLSFDAWNNDSFDLKTKPSYLNEFCKNEKSLHTIYLCLNYFEYAELKENNSIINKIDSIIIDARLDNGEHVDLNKDIPAPYTDKNKFHESAGFYIFNDLIHLGVPAERMCFMTGEKNSFDDFKKKCTEIHMPEPKAFEKVDSSYNDLKQWLEGQCSDYVKLRRGVIEGCDFLKELIENNDNNIRLRSFIKGTKNGKPEIVIENEDMQDYLEIIAQFLSSREPGTINHAYRLFLRALLHEWESNINPDETSERYGGDIHTFAKLAKTTRNWVAHAKLLEPLDEKFIAFMFLINMRAMFILPLEIQPYEHSLLCLINSSPVDRIETNELQNKIDDADKLISQQLSTLDISLKRTTKNDKEIEKYFIEKVNDIYIEVTGEPNKNEYCFKDLLFACFFANQKNNLTKLAKNTLDFLPTLARHIYLHSFQRPKP